MQLLGPFSDQAAIDPRFTGEGRDASPPLKWVQAPDKTVSFALICDDPDAPSPKRPAAEPWVHWVIYNIPASTAALPEGVARDAEPSQVQGAKQGKNSWPADNVGYHGPMPPPGSGRHRYFFRLYALDCQLNIQPAGATKSAVVAAMRNHVLAEAELVGTYERN
jgi:Raf kinase inhibitor-like YbhB/YbcL family protein